MKPKKFVEIHNHPGFLIRRSHQIYNAIWERIMAPLDLSPQQFALLYTAYFHDGIDVTGLAWSIGIDKTSAGRLVMQLCRKRYLKAVDGRKDKRQKEIFLTAKGKKTVISAWPKTEELSDRLLDCFTTTQAEQFVKLLEKFVSSNNDYSRAPIKISEPFVRTGVKSRADASQAT